MGDKGYVGPVAVMVPFKETTPLTEWQRAFNRMHNSVRVTVEWAIGRIKRFRCLKERWHHSLELHSKVFGICANIAQISMYFYPVRRILNSHLLYILSVVIFH